MSQEAWPAPQGPSREPLPRVEDLPIAEQGYEQESVRAAFDSFYRHAAQLDAALRTLEAVDSFQRQAAALRADLRTLRTSGWTQQPWTATPAYGYATRVPREGVSPTVWRIAGEVAFLIAVAVGLGVAKVAWWFIVLVMAAAWLVVLAIEWTASRDRWVTGASAATLGHPIVEASPAERASDEEALGWSAFEEPQEPSDAMTMIGAPAVEEVAPPAVELPEPPTDEDVSPPPAEPALAEVEQSRRRWWRRGDDGHDDSAEALAAPELPHHVRVLPAGEAVESGALDPWEQGFDAEDREGPEVVAAGPDELPAEVDRDHAARHRFRRR